MDSPALDGAYRSRFLVVDDESVVRATYKNILVGVNAKTVREITQAPALAPILTYLRAARSPEEDEREVVFCENGTDGIYAVEGALAESRPFSVAYIDVKMPKGPDGIETAAAIRRLDPFIQIVIVTGYSEVPINAIMRRVPPVEKLYYIQKPFQAAEILQLASALDAKWRKEHDYLRIKRELEARLDEGNAALIATSTDLRIEKDKLRQVEEAYRHSEALKRATWEASKDALIVADAQGILTSLNPAAEAMFRLHAVDAEGQPVSSLFEADSRSSLDFHCTDMRHARTLECHGRTAEGRVFPVELSISCGEEGQRRFLMLSVRDIHERRATEERLRLLTAAFAAAANGVLVARTDGSIIWVNPAFSALTGWQAEEVAGKTPRLLRSGRQDASFYAELWGTISRGEVWHGELINRRKDGSEYDEEMTITPVPDETGQVSHFIAIKNDITTRKLAREALERAKQEAEGMSQAKSNFLANMSHEIRTPMNGVLGMLAFLKDTKLQPLQSEYVEMALNSATSLMSIIDDILDFSKIEAGKFVLEPLPFDLHGTAEDVVRLIQNRAREKNLELVLHYAPELPSRFIGDAGRLRQVLTNLLGNAVKFTEHGYVILHIEGEKLAAGVHLRLRVEDSGIGIAPERLERIFEKFTQADASTTRKYGGTGLGLTICRQLLELMGGSIRVESKEGMGSTFLCELTLPADPQAPLPKPVGTDLRQTRVLIVEPSPLYRRLYGEQFESWGVPYKAASSAADAMFELRVAEQEGKPFRLALVDEQLPDMPSAEFGEALRHNPTFASIKRLLTTGAGQRGDAKRAQEAGYGAYLVKPIRSSHLMDAMCSLLSGPDANTPLVTRYSIEENRRLMGNQNHESTRLAARILLAEDNLVNQKVATGVLERFGCTVMVAPNGQEALHLLEAQPFDMIFMDCQMPVMDGFEATRLIREQETSQHLPHLPIVAMTAHAVQGAREQCLSIGMDDYVSKPLDVQLVRAAVERWYKGGETVEAITPPEPAPVAPPTAPAEPVPTPAVIEPVAPPAPAGEAATAVFDKVQALQIVGGDETLLDIVLDAFLFDVPKQIIVLREALDKTDASGVEKRAHALKGAGANIGARKFSMIAKLLEYAARAGETEKLERLGTALIQAFAELEQTLRNLKAGGSNG